MFLAVLLGAVVDFAGEVVIVTVSEARRETILEHLQGISDLLRVVLAIAFKVVAVVVSVKARLLEITKVDAINSTHLQAAITMGDMVFKTSTVKLRVVMVAANHPKPTTIVRRTIQRKLDKNQYNHNRPASRMLPLLNLTLRMVTPRQLTTQLLLNPLLRPPDIPSHLKLRGRTRLLSLIQWTQQPLSTAPLIPAILKLLRDQRLSHHTPLRLRIPPQLELIPKLTCPNKHPRLELRTQRLDKWLIR